MSATCGPALEQEQEKNWIVNRALKEFLERHAQQDLRAEARRQSLAASRRKWKDELAWEKAASEVWNE